MDFPPVLPQLKDQVESYLLNPENLSIHRPEFCRKWWPRTPDPTRLYKIDVLPCTSRLTVERDPASGMIIGLKEVHDKEFGSTNKNSFSLRRAPGPPEQSVRGSSSNFPFWPGGFPEPELQDIKMDYEIDFKNLKVKHPKLSRGIDFGPSKNSSQEETVEPQEDQSLVEIEEKIDDNNVNLKNMLKIDLNSLNIFEVKTSKDKPKNTLTLENLNEDDEKLVSSFSVEQEPAKNNKDVIKISEGASKGKLIGKKHQWAELIDVNEPVDDFETKVPNPACTYPFELDVFQKQAVLHLEKQECVFVAAHTSAGKTVVAEYAIALSLKHMTRTIYTSPIKALSNQKYRDLKIKFEDVGLLTGDIQINPKASCLIMTTEILQSMLYNGSDVIRDLECVIFDEVHYINNAERGHVWEEVLIMLPSHINIVLLSATVPNTLEFADWIGRIKKRKIYVISTTKRPVPLEHYLYTGKGGKSKDERFLIVDSNSQFVTRGYNDAVAAIKDREKKHTQTHGPKQGFRGQMGEKEEKNMWIGLIDHLSKRDLLPVVAFTLSKKRCDQNAAQLESQDLTTQKEKGEIHNFIKKCMERLQGSDKLLPQVIHMRNLLKKGIGVHHSGILPILKEVVEMLFAKGLVKLLFATETFAMGVNMPARSVVFDSIRKHDGTQFRDLIPSEYIQMAGRAGRRGLDTTGTVIILCKNEVHEMSDLHRMMLGKPAKLESQFKLTYSMILNLLRIEALRVEDMMKRSFSEVIQLKNQSKYEHDFKAKNNLLESLIDLNCVTCEGIANFYAHAKDYCKQRSETFEAIHKLSSVVKILNPGKFVLISHNQYQNWPACLLKFDLKSKNCFTVLILQDSKSLESDNLTIEEILIKQCLSVNEKGICILDDIAGHDILEITASSIAGIFKKSIKIDGKKIIDNVEKRKIPRFKDDPPGKSVTEVINDLQKLNETKGEELVLLHPINDMNVRDIYSVAMIHKMNIFLEKAQSQSCLECPQFSDHFKVSIKRLKLLEDIGKLKFLMSEEALQLHPEYQMRIDVLKQMGYIENNNIVTLKGRVACEMGNHELMTTELILENAFADKAIEEIAALLSCLVFQQKYCSEANLTEDLAKGVEQFQKVAKKIGEMQCDCGLKETVGDFVDQYKFGLVEVVYQWARGLPFNKIMELTDVQEGVVVKCIQRLVETLKDVKNAARTIGDPDLYEKMDKASTAIKRDIVFAASLYTQ